MKTLREYIDLITEAEQVGTLADVPKLVGTKGIPNSVSFNGKVVLEEYFEDDEWGYIETYGNGLIFAENANQYHDVNSLIQVIKQMISANDTEESWDYDNVDWVGDKDHINHDVVLATMAKKGVPEDDFYQYVGNFRLPESEATRFFTNPNKQVSVNWPDQTLIVK